MSDSMPETTSKQQFKIGEIVYYSGPKHRRTPFACAYMVLAWDRVDDTYTLISGLHPIPQVVLPGASPDDMVLVPKTKARLLEIEFPYIDRSTTGGWPETAASSDIVKENSKRTRHGD